MITINWMKIGDIILGKNCEYSGQHIVNGRKKAYCNLYHHIVEEEFCIEECEKGEHDYQYSEVIEWK